MSGGADTSEVVLAPAKPVDPERIGALIYDTDPHIFGYLHRHDLELAHRHLGRQWQAEGGSMSFSFATGAYLDGHLAGIEIGYGATDRAAASDPFNRCLVESLSGDQLDPWVSWAGVGTFVIPQIPDDAYYLQHLAVDPDVRDRGVGGQLLDNAFARAADAGYASVHLDVYDGNPAQRLYERSGMSVLAETMVPALAEHGLGLHRRLSINL